MSVISRLAVALSLVSAGALAAPPKQPGVAVLGLRSSLSLDEKKTIDDAQLVEVIQEAAEHAFPDAHVMGPDDLPAAMVDGCALDCRLAAARAAGASLLVTGDLLRLERGLLASLELRDVESGSVKAFETALAAKSDELPEAVSRAAADLFAAKPPLVEGVGALPSVPEPPGVLQPGGALQLQVDAAVLQSYDVARRADARGKEFPREAETAWELLASLDGRNPYREEASARAAQWRSYADTKSAFEAQHKNDTEQLRRVLPLASVKDDARLQMLGRYARAYGASEARPYVALLPEPLRAQAGIIVECEGGEADKCTALAQLDEESKDSQAALAHLELACSAGVAPACAEVGDRLLAGAARDPARAIPALQRGCGAGSGRACARLARLYEEGDGTDANLAIADDLRARACSAGDGRSCRRLGCSVEGSDSAKELAQALALWKRGCENGDALSCAMARAAAPRRAVKPKAAFDAPPPKSAPAPGLHFPPPPPEDSNDTIVMRLFGLGFLTGGAVLAGEGVSKTSDWTRIESSWGSHRDPRGGWEGAGPAGRATPYLFGAAASTTLGLVLLLVPAEPKKPSVSVTASPGGLVLSGKFE